MLAATHYLNLIFYKAYADLRAESERTYAGFAWWVIEPIIHMFVYYLVFKVFLNRGTEDYFAFLLVGLTAWKWIETGVKVSTPSIQMNAGLIKQVSLPKLVFPTVVIFVNTFKFAVALLVIVTLLWALGHTPNMSYAALPLLVAVEFLFVLGLAYLFAAIHPFVPDISVLIDNGFRLIFFLSGIFFTGDSLSEGAQRWFYLNPIAHLLESYRNVLLYGEAPRWGGLLMTVAVSVVALGVGAALLHCFDKTYPRLTQL